MNARGAVVHVQTGAKQTVRSSLDATVIPRDNL